MARGRIRDVGQSLGGDVVDGGLHGRRKPRGEVGLKFDGQMCVVGKHLEGRLETAVGEHSRVDPAAATSAPTSRGRRAEPRSRPPACCRPFCPSTVPNGCEKSETARSPSNDSRPEPGAVEDQYGHPHADGRPQRSDASAQIRQLQPGLGREPIDRVDAADSAHVARVAIHICPRERVNGSGQLPTVPLWERTRA
jgi:hypothetical protein